MSDRFFLFFSSNFIRKIIDPMIEHPLPRSTATAGGKSLKRVKKVPATKSGRANKAGSTSKIRRLFGLSSALMRLKQAILLKEALWYAMTRLVRLGCLRWLSYLQRCHPN